MHITLSLLLPLVLSLSAAAAHTVRKSSSKRSASLSLTHHRVHLNITNDTHETAPRELEMKALRNEYMQKLTSSAASSADDGEFLAACTRYTRLGASNSTLKCSDALMAHSGAAYLRSILPSVADVPGMAKLRILDSFEPTSTPDACSFTAPSDGRHFYPLDFIQLRALAEGVLSVLGDSSGGGGSGGGDDANSRSVFTSPGQSLGDFDGLIRRAFDGRHVVFIGDSTTGLLHHQLTAWALASSQGRPADEDVRARLVNNYNRTLTSQAAFEILKHVRRQQIADCRYTTS